MTDQIIEPHRVENGGEVLAAHRVVIVKLSAVGDVIHTLPVLPRLKAQRPSPYICWVVEAKAADLLRDHPLIDELVIIDTHRWRKSLLQPSALWPLSSLALRFLVHLRRFRAHAVYDFQGLIKSGVITRLTGARERVGFRRELCREGLNTWFTNSRRGPIDGAVHHVVDLNLSLLQTDGVQAAETDFAVHVDQASQESVNRFLMSRVASDELLVGVNPGAGWATKRWPADRYGALCRELESAPGIRVILLWGPGEEELVEEVRRHSGVDLLIAPPTSLKQLYFLLSKCDLFIGGDTGPLHMAAAAGCPALALFGPSDPRRNGPYGSRHTVIWKRPTCAPCYKRTCEKAGECLESIPANLVIEYAQRMITGIRGDHVQPAWLDIP